MMFHMYRDKDGCWGWWLVTVSGQILAECPSPYPHKEDCRAAIQLVKDCRLARVHEVPPPVATELVAG